jgi:hypothetical protein
MKTLRILAWVLFFLISDTGNAAITIQATSATVDRLIGANDDFDVGRNPRYDERIGESHQSMLGRVLFGLAIQDDFAFGTGVGMAVDRSLRILGGDNHAYRVAMDGDNILRRKYAVILGILPDGSSAPTNEIDTRGPEPDEWAIIVLGIGFIVYQMRPRSTRRATNLAGDA